MDDLINRAAPLEKAWDADTRCGYVQVVDVGDIEDAPAIEAEPVVYGQWVKDRDTIKCPACGFGMFPIPCFFKDGVCVGGPLIPKHCPDCGVRLENRA